MSKRQARRELAAIKRGQTAKEFLTLCNDMGFWFDEVRDDETGLLLEIYNALTRKES